MAEVVWTEPALQDLDAIADYIALDKPEAAKTFARKVFERVGQLSRFPQSGSTPPELQGMKYRQLVEPPCRIFYRLTGQRVFILHVMRSERLLKRGTILKRARMAKVSRLATNVKKF